MKLDLSEKHAAFQGDRHYWERARAAFVLKLLDSLDESTGTLLDVGCGDGYLVRRMAERFPERHFFAVDSAFTPEQMTNLRTDRIEPATMIDFENPGRCNAATLFDVLEHIDDDDAFLSSLYAYLAPGGQAVFTVPAFQFLFGAHDRMLSHFRRYSHPELVAKLRRAGFEVTESGYFFSSLLGPRLLLKCLGRDAAGAVGHGAVRPLVMNALLDKILQLDAGICRALARLGIRIPGLSVYALCRKPS
ncbi:MAG: trans-aconitate 2-methyltransferase [Victivallaceae bacterium]